MKKEKKRIISILATLFLCIVICACANSEEQGIRNESRSSGESEGISWVENEDGSYTFTNNNGEKGSIYAWYVLDEAGQAIYKEKYSKSPDFTYDLEENDKLTIKGFIRNGTGEEYEQVSMKISAEDILDPGEYGGYEVMSAPTTEEMVDLLRNQVLQGGQETLPTESVLAGDGSAWNVDLAIPVDWSCPDIVNRSYGFMTNGLSFLDETYRSYCDTRDERYVRAIMEYMIDWAEQNTEYNKADEWTWHDDATAWRVLRMSLYYYEFKDLFSEDGQKLIEKSLKYQAELLTTEEFYTEKHNHGMHQDIALLAYALLLEEDKKEEYIATALDRTGEYLDYVYSEDGIHKEHSPSYARHILARMIFMQEITKDISPDFSNHIGQYVVGAQEYLLQIIKPDGTWPSIGDSPKRANIAIALTDLLEGSEEHLWIISDGQSGVMPADRSVFAEGGYAVFRSSWKEKADEATWMMLVASTFSSTHKHGDDLEVLLYHKGDLFVEAGRRDYNYTEEMTAWAYSGYAHNVLLVDGEAYPVKVGENGFQSIYSEALETRITDYDIDGDIARVTGQEHRFDGVEQERTLAYDKGNDKVTISDVLEADKDFEGTLLYHVAEGVDVEETSDGWNLYRGEELVAVVSVTGNVDFEVDTVRGENGEYPYQTWIFDGKKEPVYGSLLKINISGKLGNNKIDTSIDLK